MHILLVFITLLDTWHLKLRIKAG